MNKIIFVFCVVALTIGGVFGDSDNNITPYDSAKVEELVMNGFKLRQIKWYDKTTIWSVSHTFIPENMSFYYIVGAWNGKVSIHATYQYDAALDDYILAYWTIGTSQKIASPCVFVSVDDEDSKMFCCMERNVDSINLYSIDWKLSDVYSISISYKNSDGISIEDEFRVTSGVKNVKDAIKKISNDKDKIKSF